MITNFKYNDIVLYAKGWYQRSNNIVNDLDYLFSKIYGWTHPVEYDVADRMLRALSRLYEEAGVYSGTKVPYSWLVEHYLFEEEVRRRIILYKCSREKAIILVVLSILQELDRDQIKLNKPHYGKKEHFRMGSLFGAYPISMTYKEMNRIASKMFD